MSIKAPFQSDPAHKVRTIIFQTCQTLHLPELDLTEALTFAKEMVMTFFIKQGREEIFLFGQLPHQFLLVLGRGHFLKHKLKKKKSAAVNHLCPRRAHKHVPWDLESALTSIFSFSSFRPLNILISNLPQKLNPSTSNPGVLSSHS